MDVKSLGAIAEKYARVTPQRAGDYTSGVQTTPVDWSKVTQAAGASYAAGVQAAITRKGFEKGVAAAGTERWRAKSVDVGSARWGPGVQAGAGDYASRFGPYADVLSKLSLPARFPTGDPRNYARVQAIGEALNKKRLSG
jgi:hypothetical protein